MTDTFAPFDVPDFIRDKQKNDDLRQYTDRHPMPKIDAAYKKRLDAAEEGKGEFIRGEYKILRVPQVAALYEVTRLDNGPVPEKLQGQFTSVMFIENLIRSLT